MMADAVVVNSRGEILLIKRAQNPFAKRWALPGGFLDEDETLEETAAREAFEETNVRVCSPRLIGLFDDPRRDPDQKVTVAYAFRVKGSEKARITDPNEVLGVRWVHPSKLSEYQLAFDHADIIARYLANRPVHANVLQRIKDLLSCLKHRR